MGQGKRQRRGSRRRVDWRDIMMTLFYSDASEEEILAMSPRERKQAQAEGQRQRYAPGCRSWGTEEMAVWKAWQDSKAPDKIWDWRKYLVSIGRPDLGRDITTVAGFYCGRCSRSHDRPYCVPNERLWLCKGCAEASGKPMQAGTLGATARGLGGASSHDSGTW